MPGHDGFYGISKSQEIGRFFLSAFARQPAGEILTLWTDTIYSACKLLTGFAFAAPNICMAIVIKAMIIVDARDKRFFRPLRHEDAKKGCQATRLMRNGARVSLVPILLQASACVCDLSQPIPLPDTGRRVMIK
jgi:hypothetical protein